VEIYRGVVRSYHQSTHTADVLLVGSMSRLVLALPVSQQIGAELMGEGAACGVVFFAGGGSGLVLCTFDGAPGPWVTSALIKDGAVAPTDLSFSPATPELYFGSAQTDQEVLNSWATYQSLSKQVTVPSGKTFSVLALGSAEFECTTYTNWNLDVACIYSGASQLGSPMALRMNAVNERGTVTVLGSEQITSTAAYSLKVYKAVDRNTEVCRRANLSVLWWEDTQEG
jgi:hypothetical protein